MRSSTIFNLTIVFIASCAAAIAFQNCGSDAQVSPSLLAVDGEGNELSDGTTFNFNLGAGDAFVYVDRLDLDAPEESVSYSLGMVGVQEVIEIYEVNSNPPSPDLPGSYCLNSALPHCRHLNTQTCQAIGCPPIPKPLRCSSSRRVREPELSSIFALFSGLELLPKPAGDSGPAPASCNRFPYILFSKQNGDSNQVALYDFSCVAQDELYALSNSGELIEAMRGKVTAVRDAGGFCNRFVLYNWQTTNFNYQSASGFTTPQNITSYNVNYTNGNVSMVFRRPGDTQNICANNINLNQNQIETFFPPDGLSYQVLRTSSPPLPDAATATITYTDSEYGANKEYKFS